MPRATTTARAPPTPRCRPRPATTAGSYLKIMHTDRDPFVDPVADDLASVTLDLLVSDAGLQRHGVNLMLLFGEPDTPPDTPPDPPGGA
ncbi:MAG: formate dehydrogenase accessory protein FdhE [Piscinibacter sp.]|nr:formate dehydrogenase accessory protein FdhE [Piscinibacter sp.]